MKKGRLYRVHFNKSHFIAWTCVPCRKTMGAREQARILERLRVTSFFTNFNGGKQQFHKRNSQKKFSANAMLVIG